MHVRKDICHYEDPFSQISTIQTRTRIHSGHNTFRMEIHARRPPRSKLKRPLQMRPTKESGRQLHTTSHDSRLCHTLKTFRPRGNDGRPPTSSDGIQHKITRAPVLQNKTHAEVRNHNNNSKQLVGASKPRPRAMNCNIDKTCGSCATTEQAPPCTFVASATPTKLLPRRPLSTHTRRRRGPANGFVPKSALFTDVSTLTTFNTPLLTNCWTKSGRA